MKAAEKNIQKLSSSQAKITNVKYFFSRWKINLATLEDYLEYMEDENTNTSID